ncbi:hypothetical protein DL765_009268 [Monosporascus sp. GIB2]|nr:hypothetical protein DL765_009268 [Monosporascus sp. GIB2]
MANATRTRSASLHSQPQEKSPNGTPYRAYPAGTDTEVSRVGRYGCARPASTINIVIYDEQCVEHNKFLIIKPVRVRLVNDGPRRAPVPAEVGPELGAEAAIRGTAEDVWDSLCAAFHAAISARLLIPSRSLLAGNVQFRSHLPCTR